MDDSNLICPSKNCNLRFPSESHLKIHKKKHDMVLSLNRPTISTTDQTPTPTRLLRKCEEIGLFQDLQNVNPFEETFKKAVENGVPSRHEAITFLGKTTGDELHTPHLFPEVQEEINISDDDDDDVAEEVVVRSEADTSLKPPTPQPSPPLNDEIQKATINSSAEPVQVILRMPNGTLVQLSTKPLQTFAVSDTVAIAPTLKNSSNTVILAATPEIVHEPTLVRPAPPPLPPNADVKEKLKAFLGGAAKSSTKKSADWSKPGVTSKSKAKPQSSPPKKAQDKTESEIEREKRQLTLKRNREAAYRCRAKRKKWVEELSKNADQMAMANRALVHEVAILRDEVARLKGLLLAHAHCPVTLAANARLEHIPVVENKIVVRREKLTLNIRKASENSIMDLDSPSSVVKRDEVLTSVAPPSTPDERIVTFPELDHDGESDLSESLDDKISSIGATTVIQINPNVLKTHGFS